MAASILKRKKKINFFNTVVETQKLNPSGQKSNKFLLKYIERDTKRKASLL